LPIQQWGICHLKGEICTFLDSDFRTLIENRNNFQFSQAVCAKSSGKHNNEQKHDSHRDKKKSRSSWQLSKLTSLLLDVQYKGVTVVPNKINFLDHLNNTIYSIVGC
jgi:hypothetical protein